MKSYPRRILKGDRISIPSEIMKELNLKKGDLLSSKCDGKGLVFVPCKIVELTFSNN